jgi:hypothetical protein
MTFQGILRGVIYSFGASLLIFSSAHAQQWDWVKRFSGDSSGTAVAVDNDGNAFVAGVFAGTNTFGEKEFVSAGGNDVFLLKLDSDGNVLWSLTTGGAINDAIHGLALGSNGSLFLLGDFTLSAALLPESYPDRTKDLDRVCLARIDEGKFTWVDTNIYPTSLTIVPDGTLRVAGYWNGMVGAHFTENGDLLELQRVPANQMAGAKIVADIDGEIYGARTFFSQRFELGTNQITQNYYSAQITAGLSHEGVRWYWSASLGYESRAMDIAPAMFGGALSIGYVDIRLPRRDGFIVKHSRDGTQQWRRDIGYGCTKHFWTPTALTTAPDGTILVAGGANPCPISPTYPGHIWLIAFDQNGNQIREEAFGMDDSEIAPSPQLQIAADSEGAVLMIGKARFLSYGTNASAGGGPAFILRRSTLEPVLRREISGGSITLSWPRAAYPFALQQKDAVGTDWSFVTNIPVRTGARWFVTLPTDMAGADFRLFRTNEVPIRYPARVQWWPIGGSYLDRANAFALHRNASTIAQSFSVGVRADGPGTVVTVEVLDLQNGEPLAVPQSFAVSPYTPQNSRRISCYCIAIRTVTLSFPAGQHELALRVSDGVDVYTNHVQFAVISFETALQELRARFEALSQLEGGKRVNKLFEQALRAEDRARKKLALQLWTHFQRRLGRVRSITDDERTQLSVAASQLQALAGN